MKVHTIREFQRLFPGVLGDLPAQITRHGKVVAVVVAPENAPEKNKIIKADNGGFVLCNKHLGSYKTTCGCP